VQPHQGSLTKELDWKRNVSEVDPAACTALGARPPAATTPASRRRAPPVRRDTRPRRSSGSPSAPLRERGAGSGGRRARCRRAPRRARGRGAAAAGPPAARAQWSSDEHLAS